MELFEAIAQANRNNMGRIQGCQYAIVSDNQDPLGLGRVQAYEPAKGAKSSTDWLFRILPMYGLTPPVPRVGDTVLIGYVDADPHKGVYWGLVVNAVNPPVGQANNLTVNIGTTLIAITPDGQIDISGVTSVAINGKQVATLGAKDSRNDTLVEKGWT
jgi:hypothetical protein